MENNPQKNPFAVMEEEVLNFWNKNKTFEKSVAKDAPKGEYVFYDGPPFITGLPHYATLLPSIVKDVVPRYQTMKGYKVKRVWGWDCHGLPAENKVEKELGLKNKQDIEELGVGKFVDACRNYVKEGSEQWKWYIDRIARWVDMDNAYKTMDLDFMESVIWAFKELHKKGLIYEGYRSSLHCPRCATPLSKFEITMDAGSYRDVTDESVVVKFKIKNEEFRIKNKLEGDVFILAWTTTPWTLPGNLALAVGKNIEYYLIQKSKIKNQNDNSKLKNNEFYILAKDRLGELLKDENYKTIKEIKGEDLIGGEYEPLFDLKNEEIENSQSAYKIYNGNFVSTEDGTGIVHIAPNFGEDDFELGKANDLPMIDLMDEMGHYKDAGDFSGLYYKKAGQKVMAELGDKLFSKFPYTHSYPFCYRCDTPLVYKTQKAWYLKIDEIRSRMIETNKDINWVPEYFKEGRFQYNLENAPDWCLSRSRYWGSPIPVWRCESCAEIKVAGSLAEIKELSGVEVTDLHRPAIDEVEFKCKCGGKMKRVKEVMDCWFESGSMPFAQFHFPFNQKEEVDFKKPNFSFPADFIIEYTGQLRGWFYYLHVLSNALFDSLAFRNVIVSGVLAGTDGRKMSKSFGNYPDPRTTIDKYGADALRMYFMSSSIMSGGDTSLNEKDIQDALRKNIMILWNVLKFYEMFASESKVESRKSKVESKNILDQWILARLNQLIEEVTNGLEKYDMPGASKPIVDFIDDLSTWYIRRSRDRFKGDDETDKQAALETTGFVLLQLSKVIAPFMPFMAEQVWQKVTGNNFKDGDKSVHLEAWPSQLKITNLAYRQAGDELKIIEEMMVVRKIVELGLAKRDEAGIKVRQPLRELKVKSIKLKVGAEYTDLIKDEVNVKNVVFAKGEGELSVELDTEISDDLKLEGVKRELVRLINNLRKDAGLTIQDRAEIYFESDSVEVKQTIQVYKKEILKDTLADDLKFEIADDLDLIKEAKVNGEEIRLGLKKV